MASRLPTTRSSMARRRVRGRARRPAGGFTLVELLVSTGLVVLMMLMFAEIFQMAGGIMGTQRGIAENDQRARTLSTVLKGDLDKRTFRAVVPFAANETMPLAGDPNAALLDFTNRQGFLSISENSPFNDSDDVLHFTMQSTIVVTNKDVTPYFGRATESLGSSDPNQPDWDDGRFGDGASVSTAAEVIYFVRNKTLYRRVLLIREPPPTVTDVQPQNAAADRFFDPPYAGEFWREFDFSAYHDASAGVMFHGLGSLNNDTSISAAGLVLANPARRFGHDHETGQPREYVDPASPATFLGRFTHEETSHDDFEYPARVDTMIGSPMSQARTLTFDAINGRVAEFADGSRRSQDVLMTHVHSFDVKIWDDALGRFVDVGHDDPAGDYAQAKNQHAGAATPIVYGPNTTAANNRVFDTWHPGIDIDGTAGNDPPPFRAMHDNGTPANPSDDFPKQLRAIQITIRYHDVSSDQMRQLTLVQSLMN